MLNLVKKKKMMKNFTFKKTAKRIGMLGVLLCSTVSTFAGEMAYHYYYAKMQALPTGKGLVYADALSTAEPSYQDSQDCKFMRNTLVQDPSTTFYVWAQPAEGYLLAGWSADGETLTTNDGTQPLAMLIRAKTEGRDEGLDLPTFYPLEPDSTYYAMFARVVTRSVVGEENLGSIEVSKVLNDLGDEITLTATPNYNNVSFAYWKNSKGEIITDNPLALTVNEAETYKAYFDCDTTTRFSFPEGGGYVLFSSPRAAYLSGNMSGCIVTPDSVEDGNVNLYRLGFSINANQGYLLYGEGECTISYYDDPYDRFIDNDLLIASGSTGVSLDTLDTKDKSYFVFQNGQFVRTTTGFVEPNTAYLSIPDSCGVTADILFINGSSLPTDINDVKASVSTAKPIKGIYDLSGRPLTTPIKNRIVIIDGKKVIYREQ